MLILWSVTEISQYFLFQKTKIKYFDYCIFHVCGKYLALRQPEDALVNALYNLLYNSLHHVLYNSLVSTHHFSNCL